MATGYKLPNGTKSTIGFSFTGRTSWSYIPPGGGVRTYISAITGNGYIRAWNSGDISTSYPASQYNQTRGSVYVRNGDNVTPAGQITSVNYFGITKSSTTVGSNSSGGGTMGGANEVWEDTGTANVVATPNTGFMVTAESSGTATVPSASAVNIPVSYGSSYNASATFTQYYNISFNSNQGSGSVAAMNQCLWNTDYQLPNTGFTRSGWTLNGWNTAANGSGIHYALGANVRNLTTIAGGTVTLYAEWVRYSVTFNIGTSGATGGPGPIYGPYNAALTMPAFTGTPPTGYHFNGWQIGSQTLAAGSTYYITSNVEAVAVWAANHYNLAFNTNGGSGTVSSIASIAYNESRTLPTYSGSKTYYTFMGWARSADAESAEFGNAAVVQGVTAEDNKTITLYAVWARNKRTVTLTNPQHGNSTVSVICTDDSSMPVTDVSGVLQFQVSEGFTYTFRVTFASVYLAHKFLLNGWINPNSETLQTTKVNDTTFDLSYLCTSSSATSFTASYTQQAQYNIVVTVLGRIGSIPFVGQTPTAQIVTPKDSDDGWFGQDVEISYDMQGNTNMEFDSWTAKSGGVAYATYDPASLQPMKFFLRGNTTVEVSFRAKTATIAADVHSASAAIVGAAHASVNVSQYTAGQNSYGDTATFIADDLGSSHAFAGWFLADGNPIADSVIDGTTYTYRDRTYRRVIDGNLHLYAKYCSPIDLYFRAPTDQGGTPLATGMVYANGVGHATHVQQNVAIGDTCTINVTTTEFFQGWYNGSSPNFATDIPLQYEQSDSIVVNNAVTLSAYVVDAQSYNYIALYNYDQREGHQVYDKTLGTWTLNDGQTTSGIEAMTKAQYEAAMSAALGITFTAPADGWFYKIAGVKRITLQAATSGSLGVNVVKRYEADDMNTVLEQFSSARLQSVVNDYFAYVANYGTPAPRTVTVAYAGGSYTSQGEIDLQVAATGESGARASDGSVSKTLAQGTSVKAIAIPKNGYKFVGWYYDQEHTSLASALLTYQFNVPYNLTLCAVFAQDPNAIYEWEGSTQNKTMEWKSKLFVSNVPFNPSAMRVDSLGYPVTIGVSMFSAPNTNATRSAEIHAANQNARRLPLLRPERYMQIDIKSNREVDTVVVATSMAGLNG